MVKAKVKSKTKVAAKKAAPKIVKRVTPKTPEWQVLLQAGADYPANFDVMLDLAEGGALKFTLQHRQGARRPETLFYRMNLGKLEVKLSPSVAPMGSKSRSLILPDRFKGGILEHLLYTDSGFIDYRNSLEHDDLRKRFRTHKIALTVGAWKEKTKRLMEDLQAKGALNSYYGHDYKKRRTEAAAIIQANLGKHGL